MTAFHRLKEQPAAIYWRRRIVALLIGLTVLAVIAWAFAGALGGSAPAGGSTATHTARLTPPASLTARGATRIRTTARPGLHPCQLRDVVLSLFAGQASYTVRQMPVFEVDVVSTASQACTLDIGAGHVLLQISAGSQHIWTSADCAEGEASLVTKLHRGIPTVVPIAWDGRRSSPGCPVPGPSAPPGSYTAVASDGQLASNPLTFRIG